MRRRALLGLVAVGSSGCLRLTGGSGSRGSPTPAPPADTAEDRSSPAGDQPDRTAGPAETTAQEGEGQPALPVGLTEDGVESFLMGTHQNALAGTGFRTEWTLVRVDASTIKDQKAFRVADGAAIGTWSNRHGGEITMYRTADGGFWREDLGDRFTYGEDRHGYSIDVLTMARWLTPILSAGDWAPPSVVSERGTTVWETETTGFVDGPMRIGYFDGTFESLSAEMRVDERGIIRQFRSTFSATRDRDGKTPEYQLRYAVDSIGAVSVQTPDWLPTAKDRRPQVSAAITDDQRFVRFTLESGNAIEPATTVTLFDRESSLNQITYGLEEAIEPGETVYLYRIDGGEDRLARGSPPADASTITLENSYGLWADRATAEYFETLSL